MHAYPKRRVRDADWDIQVLSVVTIRCKERQARKEHPYTMRFLPVNVIPRSPLLLDRLVSLLGRREDCGTAVNLEQVCDALGCIDLRTARKHLRFVKAAAEGLATLTGRLASTLEQCPSVIMVPPGTGPFRTLELVWSRFLMAARSTFGSDMSQRLGHLLWQAPGIGCALLPPTGHVSVVPLVHDSG
jgi:hypothetical protein